MTKHDHNAGTVVWEHRDFGHFAQAVELTTPLKRGSGHRTHRLLFDGGPAHHGQYFYSLASAVEHAEYLFKHSYVDRIIWLEQRVNKLEAENHALRAGGTPMTAAIVKKVLTIGYPQRARAEVYASGYSKQDCVLVEGTFITKRVE